MNSKYPHIRSIFLLLVISSFMVSCDKEEYIPGTPDIVDLYTIVKNDMANFSLLTAAINRAGLQDLLSDPSNRLTLLAPGDEAFISAGLNLNAINNADPEEMRAILAYHILGSVMSLDQSFSTAHVGTVSDASVHVKSVDDDRFAANGADVINPNHRAANGILHVINRVLIDNGGNSIYRQVSSHPSLTFLAVALRRTGASPLDLARLLNDQGEYTLFAPTDAAFIAAGYADTNAINNANPGTLSEILASHILSSRAYTVDMTDTLGTLAINLNTVFLGQRTVVPSRTSYTRGFFNGAPFDRFNANITATNGVLHVIPELIRPAARTLGQQISAHASLTRFNAAIQRAAEVDEEVQTIFSNNNQLHTIIAPVNSAFDAAGYPTLTSVNNADPYGLAAFVKAHVFAGNRFPFQFRNNTIVSTLDGSNYAATVNSSTGAVSLQGASNVSPVTLTKDIVDPDLYFFKTNGLLYTVNQFLMP